MADRTQTQDGNVVVDNLSGDTGTIVSRHGSVTINHKIDSGSNVTITAATDVMIGEKIDNHSQATITAGGSVTINEKIDQHSIARISAGANILIGQKVDQHSTAFLSAMQGNITLGQGISEHAIVHRQSRSENLGTIDSGGAADGNMNAAVNPNQ